MDAQPIFLSENGKEPLYMQVYFYYKALITEKKLSAGARLPSIRSCAAALGISRTTAETAYMQLAADGYILSKPQSGYFVTDIAIQSEKQAKTVQGDGLKSALLYDFASSSADSGSFDFALWRRYIKSALRQDERLLSYGEPQGERELREAICNYVKASRNTVCTAENIVIGAGVQSLLQILCAAVGTSEKIAFQDNSFVQGRAVFADRGYTVVKNPEDAQLLYVSPSHTTRWGDSMPVTERLALVKFAAKRNILLIEDDFDSEFSYFNHPAPALQGLDGGQNVVYIGSFSKLLLPSIRISFMILPDRLMDKYREKGLNYNQTASKTEQIALCQFIRDGHLSNQIRKAKKLYTQKARELCREAREVFGDKAKIHAGETGFFIRMEICTPHPASELAARAEKKGVAVLAEADTAPNPRLLLSCSAVPCESYRKALNLLYAAIFEA